MNALRATVTDVLSLSSAGAFNVGQGLQVFVVSELSDPLGSAATLPVLEALGETRRFFQNTTRQTHLAVFTPDPSRGDQSSNARAAAVVREFEHALDHNDRGGPYQGALVDNVWVFSRQNADGLFADSPEDLSPVLGRLVSAVLSGEAMSDRSYASISQTSVMGRRRRYGAVGTARLVFPRDEIIASALARVAGRVLCESPIPESRSTPASEAFGHSRDFIRRLNLEGLVDLLRVDVEEHEIYTPFAPSLPASDPTGLSALESLKAQASKYVDEDIERFRRALGARREQLARRHRDALADEVASTLDRPVPVTRALAFIDAFEGTESPHIEGDPNDRPLTLDSLDREVRAFFDSQFEPLLFGTIEDEERVSYLGSKTLGRRDVLQRVTLDIQTKRRSLERLEGSIALLEGESAEAGEDEQETSDAPPEKALTDTEADLEDRRAEARSAKEGRAADAARRLREAGDNADELRAEMDTLRRIERATRTEVAQLDRALSDTAERRYLLDKLISDFDDSVTESQEAYTSAVRRIREARSALAAARATRMRRTRTISLTGAVITAVVYLIVGLTSSWGSPPTLVAVGATAALAGLVSLVVWAFYNAACTAAQQAIEDAQTKSARALEAVVSTYRTHYKDRFNHALFGALADWRDGVRRFAESLRTDLESFRSEYQAFSELDREVFLPVGTATLEYVTPEGGIDGLIDKRDETISARLKEFSEQAPPSSLFASYRSRGEDAFADHARAIQKAVRPAFEDIERMSLDDFLDTAFETPEQRSRVVYRAYRKAAPFVLISDLGAAVEGGAGGGPQVESIVYASVWSPEDSGPFKAALAQYEATPRYEKGGRETTADLMRVDLGYAAFQIAPFVEAEHDLRALDDGTAVFHSSNELAASAGPIVPSRLELGDESAPHRRAACLGLALGLIQDNGGQIESGLGAFTSYPALVSRMRHHSSSHYVASLESDLDKVRAESNSESLFDALGEYVMRADMDEVDQAIISGERARHSAI